MVESEFFMYPFHVRRPDPNRQIEGWKKYKKGWEVRILAEDSDDLESLQNVLKELGFNPKRPFLKRDQFVQPIYGRQAVERYLELVLD